MSKTDPHPPKDAQQAKETLALIYYDKKIAQSLLFINAFKLLEHEKDVVVQFYSDVSEVSTLMSKQQYKRIFLFDDVDTIFDIPSTVKCQVVNISMKEIIK